MMLEIWLCGSTGPSERPPLPIGLISVIIRQCTVSTGSMKARNLLCGSSISGKSRHAVLYGTRLADAYEKRAGSPLTISMVLFESLRLQHSRSEWRLPQSIQRLEIPFMAHYLSEQAIGMDHGFSELTRAWVPGIRRVNWKARALLLRMIAKLHQENKPSLIEPAYEAYHRIKSDIEDHYADPLHIGSLAKKHAISESYLRKLFMKHLHVSPKDYLTDIRMRHAERYLAYTSYTLRFIANACGYHDEFHFSKAFHKYKGMAPARFENLKTCESFNPVTVTHWCLRMYSNLGKPLCKRNKIDTKTDLRDVIQH